MRELLSPFIVDTAATLAQSSQSVGLVIDGSVRRRTKKREENNAGIMEEM